MGRAPCCDKNGLKKGPWTPEEDQKLIDYVHKHGYGNWRTLPKNAELQRCGKSCRLRWTNYLRPDIKRGRFSFEEEETIIQLHNILGNKWSAIAARLPGRTDNEIKNYWNTHIRRRLLRMGIDPVTHSPRLDLLDLSSILNSSLYNSSSTQMNISRLLGVQPLVNPELLKLAAMSSQLDQTNHNFLLQNGQENQLCNPTQIQIQVQNQYQSLISNNFQNPVQELPTCTTLTSPSVSFANEAQIMDLNVEQYPSNVTGFTFQNPNLNHDQWQSNNGAASSLTDQDYAPLPSYYYNYYGSLDQTTIVDPSSETSTFIANNSSSNHNFSFTSVLSTPSSSPTTLNSNNSTFVNGSGSTEDERESYCSNMLKFEFSDILDASNLM